MVHGDREASTGLADDVSAQPTRACPHLRRDHDVLGWKPVQRVLDRQERVRVADDTLGLDADEPEPLEAVAEPGFGHAACLFVVRGPVPQPGVERRGDDEYVVFGRVDALPREWGMQRYPTLVMEA